MQEENNMLTVEETLETLHNRGISIEPMFLRKKCRDGKIEGAVKVGDKFRGNWLIPKVWAETFKKSTRGPKTKSTK